MKLILIPLSILLLLSILSVAGLGSPSGVNPSDTFSLYDVATSQDLNGNYLYLYSDDEIPICYWNGTAIYEDDGSIHLGVAALWKNSTGTWALYYQDGTLARIETLSRTGPFGLNYQVNPEGERTFTFTDSLSWTVIIGVIMGIGALTGIKFFGSGLSEISVNLLLKGTFYLTIWGILTAMSYSLILEGGYIIFLFYFCLAFIYTVGVINEVGNN